MRIIKKDWKSGEVKLRITSSEDLWALSQLIEEGDMIRARTMRKIKMGGEDERTSAVVKRPVMLSLRVERAELAPEREALRVSGTVLEAPEDIPLASHHTITLELNSDMSLTKEWLGYQKEKLEEAAKHSHTKILICVHDREEAIIAETAPESYRVLTKLQGQVQKKYADQTSSNFYAEIATALSDYNKRKEPSHIIIASPAFWKEELMKALDDTLKKKVVIATCSSVTENAIGEVLKRQETKTALQQDRATKETLAVEEFMTMLGKGEKTTYGINHVKLAAEAGAVRKLLVSEGLLTKYRSEGKFKEIEKIMMDVERSKGEVMLIATSHEQGRKLEALTGIAALLRYDMGA